jgi:hypothetical protein
MQEEDCFLNMLRYIDVSYPCTSLQYLLELLNIVTFTGVVHNLILKQLEPSFT